MATISNTPRPGYAWDATDNVWYPIGTGPHTHADYITSSSAINPTIVDAKGDIIAATAADTVARLAVGANGTVLTAASGQATGLQWATPSSGGMTLLSTTTPSGSTTTVSSINQTHINLFIVFENIYGSSADAVFNVNLNGDTTLHSYRIIQQSAGSVSADAGDNTTGVIGNMTESSDVSRMFNGSMLISRYAESSVKNIFSQNNSKISGTNRSFMNNMQYRGGAVTSINFVLGAGTFTAGTIYIYGVK